MKLQNKINFKKFLVLTAFVVLGASSLFVISKILAAPNPFSGAIFTTDVNGATVDQNLYNSKESVYLNGGPHGQNGPLLPDGTYYFQVTDPSGATLLSSDPADCRQLIVTGGSVAGPTGSCQHAAGANGGVQLAPFNDTSSNGGEYKVWLIRQTPGNNSADRTYVDPIDTTVIHFRSFNSKTDNFKVKTFCQLNPDDSECFCELHPDDQQCNPDTFTIGGQKFYDANANGLKDMNEVPVPGFLISVTFTPPIPSETNPVVRTTDSSGNWSVENVPEGTTYVAGELVPLPCSDNTYWRQTAPAAPGTYSGTVLSNLTNLNFGNICFRPATGGKTLGFWSNKNGETIMKEGMNNFQNSLLFLRNLPLRNPTKKPSPDPFDPTTYKQFNTWLLDGNAVNMAYMLSVQLAANELDTRYGFLDPNQLVDTTDPTDPTNPRLGIVTIGFVQQQAINLLIADGYTVTGNLNRVDQELIKTILDDINNNRLPFASATPCTNICYPPPPTPIPTP